MLITGRKKYTWKGISIKQETQELATEIRILFGFKDQDCARFVAEQEIVTNPRKEEHEKLMKLLKRYCFGVKVEELEDKEV